MSLCQLRKKKLPTNCEEQTGVTCIQNVLSKWYFWGPTISVEIDQRKRVEAERRDSE